MSKVVVLAVGPVVKHKLLDAVRKQEPYFVLQSKARKVSTAATNMSLSLGNMSWFDTHEFADLLRDSSTAKTFAIILQKPYLLIDEDKLRWLE